MLVCRRIVSEFLKSSSYRSMGQLAGGKWVTEWYDASKTGGRFVRADSPFRQWVSKDGSSGFKAEANRYHLYISLACPWAHRALIMRKIKGLEKSIPLTTVAYRMLSNGWEFSPADPDPLGNSYMYQLYLKAKPDYEGRVTVPVLWDTQTNTIVNNESGEIIQMLNSEFPSSGTDIDYYPLKLKDKIDDINAYVYDRINNGVYKCGFATNQEAYEESMVPLFEGLGKIEKILDDQRFLVGNQLTIADIRLFTTLVSFDAVYVGHFKCNLKRIEDYPNLSNYLRDIYQYKGIGDTVDFQHIKGHYYISHTNINPTQVVPAGPCIDYTRPHDRNKFGS